jgi:NAD+ synthase
MIKLATDISLWMKQYAQNCKREAFVLGVSGGVDSALVSTLCANTGLPTHCVILPCESKQNETDRGEAHLKWLMDNHLNVRRHKIDLTSTFQEFFHKTCDDYSSLLAYANTKSRLRMIALYQVAIIVGGLVVGTGNKVEDFGVGFFTKYGDGGVDISPIADLTKTEVRAMSGELGVSKEIITIAPTDGLWPDARTDESQLGATYTELEWAMNYVNRPHTMLVLTDRQREVLETYKKWHKAGMHKLLPIPTYVRP